MKKSARRSVSRQARAGFGLFLGDVLALRKTLSFFFLFTLLFAALYAAVGRRDSLALTAIWPTVVYPLSALQSSYDLDQKSRRDYFLFSLPVSPLVMVLSRFLLGLLFACTGAGMLLLAVWLRSGADAVLLRSVFASFEAGVLFCCVVILMQSRFSYSEARIYSAVLTAVSFFFSYLLNGISQRSEDAGVHLWFFILAPVFVPAAAALLFLSARALRGRDD